MRLGLNDHDCPYREQAMHHAQWLAHEKQLNREASRLATFLRTVGYGMVNKYPWCCILRFALRELICPTAPQAVERGGLHWKRCGSFVACGIFHHGKWQGEQR